MKLSWLRSRHLFATKILLQFPYIHGKKTLCESHWNLVNETFLICTHKGCIFRGKQKL